MKYILFSLFTISLLSGCNNLLHYKLRPSFHEENVILNNDGLALRQRICFSRKGWIHGFCHRLTIEILDSVAVKEKKNLNLRSDTSIIRCTYHFDSAYIWNEKEGEITGKLEILDWTEEEIRVKEKMLVSVNHGAYSYKLNGIRKFVKNRSSKNKEAT